MKYLVNVVAVLAISAILLPRPARPADVPFAELLAKMAPVISSKDPQCRSILVKGVMTPDEHLSINYFVAYKHPNMVSACMYDHRDSVPYFFVADGNLIVYNPINNQAIIIKRSIVNYQLNFKQGRFSSLIYCGPSQADNNFIDIDLNSLYTKVNNVESQEAVATRMGDGICRLSQTGKQGNTLCANIDLSLSALNKFTQLEVFMKGQKHPAFKIDTIKVNEPIDDKLFEFPRIGQLRTLVKLISIDGDGKNPADFNSMVAFDVILKSCAVRSAIYDPKRANFFPRWNVDVQGFDWEKIKANDMAFVKKFKSLIKLP